MNRMERWVGGWADIVDGLVAVLSFGSLYPGLSFKWCARCVLRRPACNANEST